MFQSPLKTVAEKIKPTDTKSSVSSLRFDRSSDLIMLYSQKNYDISELVLRKINNQEKIKNKKEEIERRKRTRNKKP